jgi:7-cyano-7-deazaguanine synthase in queuosine biosynthesis
MKTLVICSGGLDSMSLAHAIAARHQLTRLVSCNYGQGHRKELDFAAVAARRLSVPHHLIDMRPIGTALTGSALTGDIDVPDGYCAEGTMPITTERSKGGEVHCGRCGTCVERREALHLAGVADPTPYADPDYWVRAVTAREGR